MRTINSIFYKLLRTFIVLTISMVCNSLFSQQSNILPLKIENSYLNSPTIDLAIEELNECLSSYKEEVGFAFDSIIFTNDNNRIKNLKISLEILNSLDDQSYVINKDKNLIIYGKSDIGILYGLYQFFNSTGINWYAPDEVYYPENLILNKGLIIGIPKAKYRGFWIYDNAADDQFVRWAARNTFNLAYSNNKKLRTQLGIKNWEGHHLLISDILGVDSLFENHPEWYGEREGKRFKIKKSSVNYQLPNFQNEEMIDYFNNQLFKMLTEGKYKDVDILNIWPGDTRFNYFDQSNQSTSYGTEMDNLFYFYYRICKFFNQAYKEQKINREVKFAGISYYLTWELPKRVELIDSLNQLENFTQILYLNERSYTDKLNTSDTSNINFGIKNDVIKWRKYLSKIGFVVYPNYSIYNDLYIDNYNNLDNDLSFMIKDSLKIFAYMHTVKNPSNQLKLYHQIIKNNFWNTWEDGILTSKDEGKFFENKYGELGLKMKELFKQDSYYKSNAKELFGLGSIQSILFQDIYWGKPIYSKDESINFIKLFIKGGKHVYPTKIFNSENLDYGHIGLEESLNGMIENIEKLKEYKKMHSQYTKVLSEDILKFEIAYSRYNLLYQSSLFYINNFDNKYIDKIQKEIDFLEKNKNMTDEGISPFQRMAYLDNYKKFIEIHNK